MAPPTSLGVFDLLPGVPDAQRTGLDGSRLDRPYGRRPRAVRHAFVLDATAARPGGASDHEPVLKLTVAVTPNSTSHPHHYWWQYELAIQTPAHVTDDDGRVADHSS